MLNSIIPESRIAAVEAALQKVFGTTAVTDISLLAGGLSGSSVYKVNQQYVLKINTTALSEMLTLAAGAGVAPPLYYQDVQNGIYISGFIENQPIRSAFDPHELVSQLAKTVKAIHAVPYHAAGNDLGETIDTLINGFRLSGILSGPVFDECFSQYEKIRNKYPWQDPEKVFSHNDLNPSNILCDGRQIWIIDWDVASLNDRYIDLANVANSFVHTAELESAFLDEYFGNVDGYKRARFYIMRQVSRIIYAMLMFQVAGQSKPAEFIHNQEMEGIGMREFGALMGTGKLSLATYEGQLFYGKALLNEAVNQMRTPRFTASLAQL